MAAIRSTTWATLAGSAGGVLCAFAQDRRERAHGLRVGLGDRRDRHRGAGPLGGHAAGLEDGDLDDERADLLRERLGEPADSELGGLVISGTRRQSTTGVWDGRHGLLGGEPRL
jgi:hypothetical protein